MAFDILSFAMGKAAGGAKKAVRIYNGAFEAAEGISDIEHQCGEIPDLIILNLDAVPEPSKVFFAVGFNQAMYNRAEEGFISFVKVASAEGGALKETASSGTESSSEGTGYEQYGGIRNATASSFTVGGTEFGLQTTELSNSYSYTAICGLV